MHKMCFEYVSRSDRLNGMQVVSMVMGSVRSSGDVFLWAGRSRVYMCRGLGRISRRFFSRRRRIQTITLYDRGCN